MHRGLLIVLTGVLLVGMAGCGSSHESQLERIEKQVEAEIAAESPQERKESLWETEGAQRHWEQQQAAKHERMQERARAGLPPLNWTAEEKQQYSTNKSICEIEPQTKLASEYGVHQDPGSISHAIGLEYRNRLDMQIAAEEGCLAGLTR